MKNSAGLKKDIAIIAAISAVLLFLIHNILSNSEKKEISEIYAPFLNHKSAWADSLINVMSTEEKIGELLHVDITDSLNPDTQKIKEFCEYYSIGSVSFSFDSVQKYLSAVNNLQYNCKIPMFVYCNKNNGIESFAYQNIVFPESDALLTVNDTALLSKYSDFSSFFNKNIGVSFTANGLLSSFSEKMLIDSSSLNGIVNILKGMISKVQKKNIIMGVELFNEKLTNDSSSFKLIESIYKQLISSGLSAIIVDSIFELTIEKKVLITDYLNKNLNYRGLIICKLNNTNELEKILNSETDIISVKGLFKSREIIEKIKTLREAGSFTDELLDKKVKRILLAKSWAGLEKFNVLRNDSTAQRLNFVLAKNIAAQLFEKSPVLLKNHNANLPVPDLNSTFSFTSIGKTVPNDFENILQYYTPKYNYKHFSADSKPSFPQSGYIVVLMNDIVIDTVSHSALLKNLKSVSKNGHLVVINNFNFENYKLFQKMNCSFIQMNSFQSVACKIAAEMIFGGIAISGKLPWKIERDGKTGLGLKTPKTRLQYSFPEEVGILEDDFSQIDSVILDGLKSSATPGCQVFLAKDGKVILNKGYGRHSYDGGSSVKWNDLYDVASVTKVMATTLATMKMIEEGKIGLNDQMEKYFKDRQIDYKRIKQDTTVVIDTFVVSDVPDMSKLLRERDTIHINDSVIIAFDTLYSRVTPRLNIFKCKVRELLTHRSGLPPAIPILRYVQYRKDKNLFPNDSIREKYKDLVLKSRRDTTKFLFEKYYSREFLKDTCDIQVAEKLYFRNEYFDTLWNDIKQIGIYSKKVYQYSDANMIVLQQAIDSVNKFPIDEYLEKKFYKPLGLQAIGFRPLKKYARERIVPTENDKGWREQSLRGYVHDPSAALLGGVAGNAGLFSCAHDLGIILQMLLNKGVYGGKRYLSENIIDLFTDYQPDTYRGLGFDKAIGKNIVSSMASRNTFGHTGFTGACIWADPDNKIVYVFLSNRVHPNVKNWRLNTLKIRQRVHDVVYLSLKKSEGFSEKIN
ncbi:MAG: hypothetical protein A2W91_10710 [Bacteroidetes bacterium GWF2_38_335]|nr:MAG: hypothetical protein A2W91_10710 [Bacteroidetes bacterium GWF2_38_335]OFY81827.1 MAG: hypothetical protein A2281_06330 [Bacteroidetes bacterium RIFOXYA12_FULL_38_20]HBS87900.1 hypothetical protein [Bacteroidales bacterium]